MAAPNPCFLMAAKHILERSTTPCTYSIIYPARSHVRTQYTVPESLEMVSRLLAKQSGSDFHGSQVRAYDDVGLTSLHIEKERTHLEEL
jgi:hypothetical protein